jgi:hypothetical protein
MCVEFQICKDVLLKIRKSVLTIFPIFRTRKVGLHKSNQSHVARPATTIFLTQRRKDAKKNRRNAAALSSLREKSSSHKFPFDRLPNQKLLQSAPHETNTSNFCERDRFRSNSVFNQTYACV